MIPLEDARRFVEAQCAPLPVVRVPLRDAQGYVLAEPVVSPLAVPPFANTAMDGFAVRARDTTEVPCELLVVGTVAAGAAPPARALSAGEAYRIMTGAIIPAGADAIVPIEHTDAGSSADRVRVLGAAGLGDCVRPAGEDIAVGQQVFDAGTVLTAGHLGVLASIGAVDVAVHRRPRVGVLSTGDELVEAPAALAPGQIHDSNRHTLLALARECGCEAVDLGLARDDEAVIEAALRDAIATCDVVVTSGGVSVGDFDYVKVVLDRLAAESASAMRWMQIAIRPAKPLAFGVVGGRLVFGLPGNPVSSMVSFELFARPALRALAGHPVGTWRRAPVRAVAAEPLRRSADGKTVFVRVTATHGDDGRLHVRQLVGQSSNLLRSMALANALAVLPDGPGADTGEPVDVLVVGDV